MKFQKCYSSCSMHEAFSIWNYTKLLKPKKIEGVKHPEITVVTPLKIFPIHMPSSILLVVKTSLSGSHTELSSTAKTCKMNLKVE